MEGPFDELARASLREALKLAEDALGTHGTRSERCKPGHVLLALLTSSGEQLAERARMLQAAIEPPYGEQDLIARIRAYVGDLDADDGLEFDLTRPFFDDHVVQALENADRLLGEEGELLWEAPPEEAIGIDALWASVLRHRSPDEERHLASLVNLPRAVELFVNRLQDSGAAPEPFRDNGEPDPDRFTETAGEVLRRACERAGELGYDRVHGPHLFLALLEAPDATAARWIRLHCALGVGPGTVAEHLERLLSLGPGSRPVEIPLRRESLAKSLVKTTSRALAQALLYQATAITPTALLWALLEKEDDNLIARCLRDTVPELNRERLLRDLEAALRQPEEEDVQPFLLPAAGVRAKDLTYLARSEKTGPAVGVDALIDQVLRGLHKRTGNGVLITGEAGVGKTQLVVELGRRMAAGEVGFLRRKKLVLVDCEGISAEQSRGQLENVLAAARGRDDVIVGLDHVEYLLRHAGHRESSNLPILQAALTRGAVQLIAIIEDRYYVELLSREYRLLELLTRVEVPEMDFDGAREALKQHGAPRLEEEFGLTIEAQAIEKAVLASRELILSERLPRKAVKVLREACERVSYEKQCRGSTATQVTENDVVAAIASRTGISKTTIAGLGNEVDFARELSQWVVGQETAVETVANRLRLIKNGMVRKGKPAAVFLFSGLTGTGKTELAKAMAKVYSTSRKLVRYDMTRFRLEHSIQGLFGVPPGYVGFESGGQLVNDLNADPYCVMLLDEAEKAHPSIWENMLSLFDEAWTVDQRNVKAYGNHAIFILTSNAGQELFRENFHPNMAPKELAALKKKVGEKLVDYRNPKTGEKPFSPEFLGRLDDVVVFGPLSRQALAEIVRIQTDALAAEWQRERKKRLEIDEEVKRKIAEESHLANQESRDARGGRVVQSNVSKYVDSVAVELMEKQVDRYQKADGIRVFLKDQETTEARYLGGSP